MRAPAAKKAVETAALMETVEKTTPQLGGSSRPGAFSPCSHSAWKTVRRCSPFPHSSHRFYDGYIQEKEDFRKGALALPWKNRRRFSHRMPRFADGSEPLLETMRKARYKRINTGRF